MKNTSPMPCLHFIVIGNPINHSKSPAIHHAFARQMGLDIRYCRQLCPKDYDSFVAVVQAFFAGGGVGANVTLPFKEMAYRLCQAHGALSADAQQAGAVNTLAMADGRLFGDNTDGKGLVHDVQKMLAKHTLGDLQNKTVLLLGAGGAARGVILPLLQAGVAHITIANRTDERAVKLAQDFAIFQDRLAVVSWDNLANLGRYDVVINATSATTTNQNLTLPKTLQANLAYDMAYGKPSPFLAHFDKAITADGLGMLIAQAAFSFELWTKICADELDLDEVAYALD